MKEAFCLCGAGELRRFRWPRFSNNRSLYRCKCCGLLQLYPYPVDSSQNTSLYAEPEYLAKISEEEYRGYFMALYEAEIASRTSLESRILDFGGGHCYYQKFLRDMGYQTTYSCEINPHLVAFARTTLKLKNVFSSLDELPSGYFDIIIANQVFEHLLDPLGVANQSLSKLLSSNGVIIITVPNAASLNRAILGSRWIGYSPREHIWFFDQSTARRVFSQSPTFRVLSTRVKSAVNSAHDRFRPSGLIKRFYYQTAMRVFEWMGRGDQLIVILQKA
jgi:SAM-dependent methyltransferase